MNLNEECLLQFLKNDLPTRWTAAASPGQQPSDSIEKPTEGFLTRNIRRIFRSRNYVSFPVAILLRRPED